MNDSTGYLADLADLLDRIFLDAGMSPALATFLRTLLVALAIGGLVILVDFLTKKIILNGIRTLVRKTKTQLDDILIKRRVFHKISHIVPALLIYFTARFIFKDYPTFEEIFERASLIYIVIIVILAVDSFINALHEIYLNLPIGKSRPIKGYIQVVKIIIYFIGVIVIISIIAKESPKTLLAGLGAMVAVLILVFRDTILGFVASIQLSANNMVKPGDWIEMPGHNADGDVLDITLNTVKVRNWDKTITTIPTYALVSESFKNWKGMEESGGRRIKRSIRIDMNSVRFVDPEMAEKLKKIHLLKDYIETRQEEIRKYNEENKIDGSILVNGRRMTNMLVRHLQPDETGLPIEIYVFCKELAWADYEKIQADIFDHILAVVPEFGLRVFQNPTGGDFLNLAKK
jgi:miniconductance mechanosensitive channel